MRQIDIEGIGRVEEGGGEGGEGEGERDALLSTALLMSASTRDRLEQIQENGVNWLAASGVHKDRHRERR